MTDTKKRALIVADFSDAGTGESFTANDTPLIAAGAYANYEAAGLVQAPPPAKAASKATDRKSPASGRKGTATVRKDPAPAPAKVPAAPAAPGSGKGGSST